MAEAKLYGQNKGGMSINGIIKDYYAYAGEQISAGDLVEYVNGIAGQTIETSVNTVLSSETRSGYAISAVQLDEKRIFIAHSYGSSYHLYGMVVTVDETTITLGNDTQLSANERAGIKISACLLANGNIFIAHSYATDYKLYGIVVKIDGTTITKGSDTGLVTGSSSYAGDIISTCLLPNGNVFIAHSYSTSYYLYGMVCSISGTTITKGSDTQLSTTSHTGDDISACLLESGKVFISHSYGSNFYLYGIICTISGTTITKGTDTSLINSYKAGATMSTVRLTDGKLLIVHKKHVDPNYYLYGIVVTISGTTITKGTDTALVTTDSVPGTNISSILLPNGNVFIAHCYTTKYYLTALIVSVDGTTITPYSHTTLNETGDTGWTTGCILLNNGNIFLAHGNYKLYAQIWGVDEENNTPTNQIAIPTYETQIRKVTTGQFDGIAKTSGEGGDDTGHKDIVSIWTKE